MRHLQRTIRRHIKSETVKWLIALILSCVTLSEKAAVLGRQ